MIPFCKIWLTKIQNFFPNVLIIWDVWRCQKPFYFLKLKLNANFCWYFIIIMRYCMSVEFHVPNLFEVPLWCNKNVKTHFGNKNQFFWLLQDFWSLYRDPLSEYLSESDQLRIKARHTKWVGQHEGWMSRKGQKCTFI